jgi:hypothetical protein
LNKALHAQIRLPTTTTTAIDLVVMVNAENSPKSEKVKSIFALPTLSVVGSGSYPLFFFFFSYSHMHRIIAGLG